VKYIYFTKTLRDLNQEQLVEFTVRNKVDGLDLAVRPGYPINPDNAIRELPQFSKRMSDAGKTIGLVSAPTDYNRPSDPKMIAVCEAAGKAGVPFVKMGYFPFRSEFQQEMKQARQSLVEFGKIAEKNNIRILYHTHSGANLGCNGIGLSWLLEGTDPHFIGVLLDPGHLSLCGGPFPMEYSAIKDRVAMLALKDFTSAKGPGRQEPVSTCVVAGRGLVAWDKVGASLRKGHFAGMATIHGEYETKDLAERERLLAQELDFFRAKLL
jgi:sugar phosphate isomerase/epimerase